MSTYTVEYRRNDGEDQTIAAIDLTDATQKAEEQRVLTNYMVCINEDGIRTQRWDRDYDNSDTNWNEVDPDEFEICGPLREITRVEVDLLGSSLQPLRCYQVGDSDWFAATSPENALELMRAMMGDEDDYEVVLTSESQLDERWGVEGEPGKDGGSLREWLAESKGPGWIGGTEP